MISKLEKIKSATMGVVVALIIYTLVLVGVLALAILVWPRGDRPCNRSTINHACQ